MVTEKSKIHFVGIIINLIFPIALVYGSKLYPVQSVILLLVFLLLTYLIFTIYNTRSFNDVLIPSIYIILCISSYNFNDITFIKLMPVLLSLSFLIVFFEGYIKKKHIILTFVNTFYRKDLDSPTKKYLQNSDGYWTIALAINSLIQLVLAFHNNTMLWALYSSIGWYIYIAIVFIIHFVYGKFYAISNNN